MLDISTRGSSPRQRTTKVFTDDIYLDTEFVMFMKDNNFIDYNSVKGVLQFLYLRAEWTIRGWKAHAAPQDVRITQYYGNSLSLKKAKIDLILEGLMQPNLPLKVATYSLSSNMKSVARIRSQKGLPVIPTKYAGWVSIKGGLYHGSYPNIFSLHPPLMYNEGFMNWIDENPLGVKE